MSASAWLEPALTTLRTAGLDLLHTGSTTGWGDAAAPLPPGRLALVVGNSAALWPALEAVLGPDPSLPDPIDAHVERALEVALAGTPLLALHLAHRATQGAGYFPVQRFAAHLGFAHLSPARLLVHPVHGPWVAVRAVVVFSVEAPRESRPAPDPCSRCPAPCVPALERALEATAATQRAAEAAEGRGRSPDVRDTGPTHALDPATPEARLLAATRAVWPHWVAVRDACPVGRASRYPTAMLRYHHAGDGWPRAAGQGEPRVL